MNPNGNNTDTVLKAYRKTFDPNNSDVSPFFKIHARRVRPKPFQHIANGLLQAILYTPPVGLYHTYLHNLHGTACHKRALTRNFGRVQTTLCKWKEGSPNAVSCLVCGGLC